jgi:hypothetical protein
MPLISQILLHYVSLGNNACASAYPVGIPAEGVKIQNKRKKITDYYSIPGRNTSIAGPWVT